MKLSSARSCRLHPQRSRRAGALFWAIAAVLTSSAAAHDFWIEPSTYAPQVGQRVALRLRVGELFVGDAVPRDPAILARFTLQRGDTEAPIDGADGIDPAGFVQAKSGDGVLLVAYESQASEARMNSEGLDRYLEQEGLESLAAERRRGEPVVALDAFSRHAKCLLQVPGGPSAGFDRQLGLELELILHRSPADLAGGGTLPIELLLRGEPLRSTPVTAIPRLRPRDQVRARTDERGRAELDLGPGEWLLKAVVADGQIGGGEARLRSRWASFTLSVPEAP